MIKPRTLELDREFGPFGDVSTHGLEHDGTHVWVATGEALRAIDPETGATVRKLDLTADAGTAFDGSHLYQLSGKQIHKLDRDTGEILASIPAPGDGMDSGLTWAEGKLWVGQYRSRKIYCIDSSTGDILRTVESDRFVTGVTWTNGELWHGTGEEGVSDIRRIDPESGEVLERYDAPDGVFVAGLSSTDEHFFCASGTTGRVRAFKRPVVEP